MVAKLKKRIIKLRTRLQQSEVEIKRLVHTVKVVEIEVKEDNEPLHEEIAKLKYEIELLQRENMEFQGMRARIDQMDKMQMEFTIKETELTIALENERMKFGPLHEENNRFRSEIDRLSRELENGRRFTLDLE